MVVHLNREEEHMWCGAPEPASRTTEAANATCHECLWAALVFGERCDRRLTQLWREKDGQKPNQG